MSEVDLFEKINGLQLLDLGCSKGGSLDHYQKYLSVPKDKSLGIDLSEKKVEECKVNGQPAILANIIDIPNDASVDLITMHHVLEHIPDFNDVKKIINKAINIANQAVIIRQPFFDSDPELFRKKVKFYWSDWGGTQTG